MKLEKDLYALLSQFATQNTASNPAYRRMYLKDGAIEVSNGVIAIRLVCKGLLASLGNPLQLLPFGFESTAKERKGKLSENGRRSKWVDLDALAVSPGDDDYLEGAQLGVAKLTEKPTKHFIQIPVMALPSVSAFCHPPENVEENAGNHSVAMYLNSQDLILVQRWQQASYLGSPAIHDLEPIGNQFVALVNARYLDLVMQVATSFGWGAVPLIEVGLNQPKGWNYAYNGSAAPGVDLALFKVGIERWDDLFSSCEIVLSCMEVGDITAELLSTPRFPIPRTSEFNPWRKAAQP